MNPYIIGITGGSGAGKTFFLKKIKEAFPNEKICVVSQDDYYFPKHAQPLDARGVENFDMPHSLDLGKFIADLNLIRKGETVTREEYTFNNPDLKPRTLIYHPAPIIIVEGIFIFYHPEILKLLNLKIFIDAEEHIKLERRIKRDREERAYSLEDVLYRHEHHVNPAYEKYIRPFRNEADIVILNNKTFDKALEIVKVFLQYKISV